MIDKWLLNHHKYDIWKIIELIFNNVNLFYLSRQKELFLQGNATNVCLFVLLGFYAAFNIISVISRRQFTYTGSLGKQTSARLKNVPCPMALHHDHRAETGDLRHMRWVCHKCWLTVHIPLSCWIPGTGITSIDVRLLRIVKEVLFLLPIITWVVNDLD